MDIVSKGYIFQTIIDTKVWVWYGVCILNLLGQNMVVFCRKGNISVEVKSFTLLREEIVST